MIPIKVDNQSSTQNQKRMAIQFNIEINQASRALQLNILHLLFRSLVIQVVEVRSLETRLCILVISTKNSSLPIFVLLATDQYALNAQSMDFIKIMESK